MKQKIAFLLIILFWMPGLSAQQVRYASSLEKAKQLSENEQKPLAILLTVRQPVSNPASVNFFSDKRVIDQYNNNFINYRIDLSDTSDVQKIVQTYHVSRFPSLLFLDAKGGILFSEPLPLPRPELLSASADKALKMAKEKSIVDFDNEYANGKTGNDFLKSYILKRENAGIRNNAALIEEYAKGLKVSDLNDYREVLFILKAGPVINGVAYKLSLLNKDVYDSIFKKEPLAIRKAINDAIIGNSMQRAIDDKNRDLAFAIANYTRSTWKSNYKEGQKQSELKYIQYYWGIKDTLQYLQRAGIYYDFNYMQLTVDSIRKIDASKIIAVRESAEMGQETGYSERNGTKIIGYSLATDQYASELNNAAWKFYLIAGNREEHLIKAMLWSKRSIELQPKPAYYDTYAHLLYKLQLYETAESVQKQAVDLAKANKEPQDKYEEELRKIKARVL
jgi:hypothetical protein